MKTSNLFPLVAGLAGAGAMYYLDPRLGHRRRVLLRDRALHFAREGVDFANRAAYDLVQRGKGLALETTRPLREGRMSDDVVMARVRTRLGRYTSHTRLISVAVREGEVTLAGPINASELQDVLQAAITTPGVRAVHNQLFAHSDLDAELGAPPSHAPHALALWQRASWPPSLRALTMLTGGALFALGARRTVPFRRLLQLAGFTAVARGVANRRLMPDRLAEVKRKMPLATARRVA